MSTRVRTVLATSNAGKAKEFHRLLSPELEVGGLPEDISLPPETGASFAANARLKAEAVAAGLGGTVAVLADDSGLEVAALGGEPGVRSARYAGEQAGDRENVSKLLEELGDRRDREARFVCALCMIVPGTAPGQRPRLLEVEGVLDGTITRMPRGDRGFGYDPVFRPVGWSLTLAEADPSHKDRVSHRGAAARELLTRLRASVPTSSDRGGADGA